MISPGLHGFVQRALALFRGRRKWLAFASFLILAAALVKLSRDAWISWRGVQARQLSARAATLLDDGYPDEGISLLQRAFQLAPDDPAVLRSLAKTCDLSTRAATRAITLWKKVVASDEATTDDRIELARAKLASADSAGAAEIVRALPDEARLSPNCAEIEAALLREQCRDREADDLLRKTWQSHPDDVECRFKLASSNYFSAFEATQRDAAVRLWEIARSGKPQAAGAMLTLLMGSVKISGDVSEMCRLARQNTRIKAADRMKIMAGCARKKPALTSAIIAEESRRFAGKPPMNRVELYEWLLSLGQGNQIIQELSEPIAGTNDVAPAPAWTPIELVFQSRELFLAYCDALILGDKWESFAGLLRHGKLPIVRLDEELMRSLCGFQLDEPQGDVDRHLAAALSFARAAHDEAGLRRVAATAERIGHLHYSVEAISSLPAANQRIRLENLGRLYHLQIQLGDVDGIMSAAESILALKPGLKPYADDLQYLRLLTGIDMESVVDDLKNATDTGRAISPAHSVIRALAAFRCGEQQMLKECARSIDPARLAVGPRAVLAGLLAAAGDCSAGVQIAGKITGATLLPDERWFLQAALR